MKLDTSTAAQIFRPVSPLPTPNAPIGDRCRCQPPDGFTPGLPEGAQDALYKFNLSRKGSEDLEAEAKKQQARAQEAISQRPPDLRAYADAKRKLAAIEDEQNGRANEQALFELSLRVQSDAGLEKAYGKATAELEKVMNDPLASEADRERARARLQAVVAEMERRD